MDNETIAALAGTLGSVGEQYRKNMDALAKSFVSACEPLQRAQNELAASLARIDWPKLHAQMEQSCDRLAGLGWTLPMNFTPRELAQRGNTDQEIEQYMLDYFTCDGGRSFEALRAEVMASTDLLRWHAILQECFDAYGRGHYLVEIPALLSIIEGAVAQSAGRLNTPQVNTRRLAADLEQAALPGTMEFQIWRSTRVVIDKLFACSDFSGPHPGELNRQWALHGRDQTQWT